MGDTPINLNSPEQLSWVVYSRKVKDKNVWSNAIDPYMKDTPFKDLIKPDRTIVYKTDAEMSRHAMALGTFARPRRMAHLLPSLISV